MYCAIRKFNEYDYSGNIEYIKEIILDYNSLDIIEKLEITRDNSRDFVFSFYGEPSKEDLKDMRDLGAVRDNVKISFSDTYLLSEAPSNIAFFYGFGAMNADSIDKLVILAETGVSDVYVTGELGFKMQEVKKISDKYNVAIRIVPNIATVSGFGLVEADNSTSFWVRPEDLETYAPYVDIVEFMCKDDKQSVFYNIYMQDKKWSGDLSMIIAGLHSIANDKLSSHFVSSRINCGKKCNLDICHSCYKFIALAEIAADNKIDIRKTEESI